MQKADFAIDRRSFIKSGSALGALGALALASSAITGAEPQIAYAIDASDTAQDQVAWSRYKVKCGSRCIFQWHTQDGKITYLLTDDANSNNLQARTYLHGCAMRAEQLNLLIKSSPTSRLAITNACKATNSLEVE